MNVRIKAHPLVIDDIDKRNDRNETQENVCKD